MTDKEALLELLKRFGIEPHPGYDNVVLAAKYGNVIGYSEFVCEFEFDSEGKFVEVGVWE